MTLRRALSLSLIGCSLAASVAVASAGATGTTTTTSAPTTTTTTSPTSTTSTTTTTVPTTTTTTTPPTYVSTLPVHVPPLQLGSTGRAVVLLQRGLASLGYWVGTTDGVFGDSTQQAVFALQKAAGLTRNGFVGGATWIALRQGVTPTARPLKGYGIEVNLGLDLVMVVRNGRVLDTLNTSTGGGYTYLEQGVKQVATTPTGLFTIQRAVDGSVTDSLGTLWRPRYFYGGYAIHGDSFVPSVPVSHGCVRVSNEAINWIWSTNIAPIGTRVLIYQ